MSRGSEGVVKRKPKESINWSSLWRRFEAWTERGVYKEWSEQKNEIQRRVEAALARKAKRR